MKTILVLLLSLKISAATAQVNIRPFPLTVCCNKTTNLIFAYPILSVDRGSPDVLVQKASAVENILQVKAAIPNFKETNLSVITSDGRLYSFCVNYSQNPVALNISFEGISGKDSEAGPKVDSVLRPRLFLTRRALLKTARDLNDAILGSDAGIITHQKRFLHDRARGQGIRVALRGIYSCDGLRWLRLEAENLGYLEFRSEFIRCYARDKSQVARNPRQEQDLPIIYPRDPVLVVGGKTRVSFVVAISPFMLARDKMMVIEMGAGSGILPLELPIPAKTLLRMRPASQKKLHNQKN